MMDYDSSSRDMDPSNRMELVEEDDERLKMAILLYALYCLYFVHDLLFLYSLYCIVYPLDQRLFSKQNNGLERVIRFVDR